MSLSIIFFISTLWLHFSTANTCPGGKYFDVNLKKCVPCSKCSPAEVLERECEGTTNTVCQMLQLLNITNFTFMTSNHASAAKGGEIVISVANKSKLSETPRVLNEQNNVYWKNLAFALIAVLCVLVLLATGIVVYTCRFTYMALSSKAGVDENDNEDAENGYVVIHRFRRPFIPVTPPSSPEVSSHTTHLDRQHRINSSYRPRRHLLNEYVDDVFESEDSAGSRSQRPPLEPIPERSEASS